MSSALKPLGLTDVELDCSAQTGTFKAPADMDVDAVLTKAAASCSKLEGWARK